MKLIIVILIVISISQMSYAASQRNWTVVAGLTGTYQFANNDSINQEILASVDLVLTRKFRFGELYGYVEGNTTPRGGGVSGLLPEANTDAGSALNKFQKGRVQISELKYQTTLDSMHEIALGLIDISGYFDQSRIASDENTQFLGASFVQNPTIDFPDYTLGIIYKHLFSSGLRFQIGFASSNGLADNPNLSYSELFEIGEEGKGLFAISSIVWAKEQFQAHLGVWGNSASHTALDGQSEDLENYGLYGLGGYSTNASNFSLRLGLANEKVTMASRYIGLAYQLSKGHYKIGVGFGRTYVSDNAPDPEGSNTSHIEIFARWDILKHLILTADAQHLNHANLGSGIATLDKNVQVIGFRLTLLYD